MRVLFGLVMLADVSHLWANWDLFRPTALWTRFPVGAVCLIWLVALILTILGSRKGTLANWICCAVMLGIVAPNEGFQQAAADSIIIGIAFLLVILPKLDARTGRWLVAFYLTSIYLDSGIHKALDGMWNGGFGVVAPMTFPSIVWNSTAMMNWLPAWILHFMGYGVVVFELTFGLLYLWRWTRVPALLLGISLHLAIAVVYPIPVFGLLMVCLYSALLPDEWYRPLARSLKPKPLRKPLVLNRLVVVSAVALWVLAIEGVYAPQYLPIRLLNKAAWLTAGIASHEVFAEGGFIDYRYQLRLVGSDGSVYPYSRGNLGAFNVRDRVWELWWKRTQHPYRTMREAEAHLLTWARWKWNTAPVRIEGRPQIAITRGIVPDLFQQNNAVPWRSIGMIRGNTIAWQTPVIDEREKLGNYMVRVWR